MIRFLYLGSMRARKPSQATLIHPLGPIDPLGVLVGAIRSAGVDYVIGVPDSGLAGVLNHLEVHLQLRYAPREDVAVAAAAGAYLGGLKPLVFMKNAGLGTSLDALMSLARACRVPMVLIIRCAGVGLDTLAHHVVMGTRTIPLLDAAGIDWRQLDGATTESIAEFIKAAFVQREIRALLVSP